MPEDKVLIWEDLFILTEYCHVSYTEFWDIPIELRKWWVERKKKENEKIKEAQDKARGKRTAPAPKAPRRQGSMPKSR